MSEPSTTAPSSRSRIISAIKLAALVIVLGFVSHALYNQFREVSWHEIHFHPALAAGAVLCMLGVSGVQLIMFRTLLGAYGFKLPWRVTLATAWIPPLGKYVPGKVASILGAVYMQRNFGVPGAVAVSVAVMLDGLAVIAGLIVSTPLLLWQPVRDRMPHAWIGCVILAFGGLVALHPRIFSGIINLVLKKFGRAPLTVIPDTHRYLPPVLAAFGQWIFAGCGLWLMTRSVTPIDPKLIPIFISTAALAMTVSYLALFAPGGVGVREFLYLVALGPIAGHAAPIVVVAMRVIQTLIELALAGVGFIALRGAGDYLTAEAQRTQR